MAAPAGTFTVDQIRSGSMVRSWRRIGSRSRPCRASRSVVRSSQATARREAPSHPADSNEGASRPQPAVHRAARTNADRCDGCGCHDCWWKALVRPRRAAPCRAAQVSPHPAADAHRRVIASNRALRQRPSHVLVPTGMIRCASTPPQPACATRRRGPRCAHSTPSADRIAIPASPVRQAVSRDAVSGAPAASLGYSRLTPSPIARSIVRMSRTRRMQAARLDRGGLVGAPHRAIERDVPLDERTRRAHRRARRLQSGLVARVADRAVELARAASGSSAGSARRAGTDRCSCSARSADGSRSSRATACRISSIVDMPVDRITGRPVRRSCAQQVVVGEARPTAIL